MISSAVADSAITDATGERKKKSGRCHSGSLSAVNVPHKQPLKARLVRMTLQRTRLGGGAGCEPEYNHSGVELDVLGWTGAA